MAASLLFANGGLGLGLVVADGHVTVEVTPVGVPIGRSRSPIRLNGRLGRPVTSTGRRRRRVTRRVGRLPTTVVRLVFGRIGRPSSGLISRPFGLVSRRPCRRPTGVGVVGRVSRRLVVTFLVFCPGRSSSAVSPAFLAGLTGREAGIAAGVGAGMVVVPEAGATDAINPEVAGVGLIVVATATVVRTVLAGTVRIGIVFGTTGVVPTSGTTATRPEVAFRNVGSVA